MKINSHLPLIDCKLNYIYTLNSRNLDFGVFTIKNTFIGIRNKFDSSFLDEELHYDRGGTALPLIEICKLPEDIPNKIDLGSYDIVTKLDVSFDRPLSDGGKGWFFIKDGISSKDIRPARKSNNSLFEFLKNLKENKYE